MDVNFDMNMFVYVGISTWPFVRRNLLGCVSIRAAAGQLGSGSNHVMADERPLYHPFEEITQVSLPGRDARLTSAETCRTIIEVLLLVRAVEQI